MYKFLTKQGTTVAFLVGTFLILLYLVLAFTGLGDAGYDVGTDLVPIAKGEEGVKNLNFFNFGIYSAVALVVIAAVLAFIVFGITGLLKFPKNSIKFLAGFGVLAVLFLIFNSMGEVETAGKLGMLHEKFKISPSVSKLISGGIMTTLTLIVAAAVVIVFSEVRNAFK